jgi:hypothetical protein
MVSCGSSFGWSYGCFVIGPLFLLLGFQLRFLPYHSITATYVHRLTLLFDLGLLALLWPKISRSGARSVQALPARVASWRFVAAGSSVVALLVFSLLFATVPQELTDQRHSLSPHSAYSDRLGFVDWIAAQRITIRGEQPVEPNADKLSKLARTVLLRDRDLRQADLSGSDLRKADLRGVDLSLADLSSANLSGADLSGANLSDANLSGVDLSGANLSEAKLIGADLYVANLNDANLSDANLTGAYLTRTNLSGANLFNVSLSDARLTDADLTGVHGLAQERLSLTCGRPSKLPPDLLPGFTLKPCP